MDDGGPREGVLGEARLGLGGMRARLGLRHRGPGQVGVEPAQRRALGDLLAAPHQDLPQGAGDGEGERGGRPRLQVAAGHHLGDEADLLGSGEADPAGGAGVRLGGGRSPVGPAAGWRGERGRGEQGRQQGEAFHGGLRGS